jgi:hypothetical protein
MRSERGQATVEWIGILLLVALALAAVSRLAPRVDGHTLGSTLAHSITHPGAAESSRAAQVAEIRSGKRNDSVPPVSKAFVAPPLVPRVGRPHAAPRLRLPDLRGLLRTRRGASLKLPETPALVRRVRGGAGAAWRRAWYACLVYERFRWAFLHPESRFPGYTMPPGEVLRIMNDCVSPVDVVRDWPALRGRAGGP